LASAKQLAARRKFSRIMKSGGFKKKKKGTTKGQVRKTARRAFVSKRKPTSKRRVSAKVKRRSNNRKPMARRRTISRTVRRSSKGIGSSLKTGVIGDVVKGIGAGSLVSLVMSRVAPNSSITPIASTGAAFLTGGIVGGAANLILSGGLGQLGGIFGGASTPQQEFGV
tara:strand:- start:305 stop:808 length:504 start_codon:yes stop_codon:yes gene_type:complete